MNTKPEKDGFYIENGQRMHDMVHRPDAKKFNAKEFLAMSSEEQAGVVAFLCPEYETGLVVMEYLTANLAFKMRDEFICNSEEKLQNYLEALKFITSEKYWLGRFSPEAFMAEIATTDAKTIIAAVLMAEGGEV